jgi:hypothetical protein
MPLWCHRGLKRSARCPEILGMSHPDFAVLTVSWELAPQADGYADDTVKAYQTCRQGPRLMRSTASNALAGIHYGQASLEPT